MAVYFDITRTYLRDHDCHPTGIKRSILGLCAAGRAYDARPLVFHPGNRRFYMISHLSGLASASGKGHPLRLRAHIYRRLPPLIQRLADALRDFNRLRAGYWKRSLAKPLSELEGKETPVDFEAGDSIYILDLNAPIPHYMQDMMRLKRTHPNLRIIGFFHDTFPMNHPEMVFGRDKRGFKKWWDFLEATCDGYLTNSQEVTDSVLRHTQNKPVRPIRFGSNIESLPGAEAGSLPDFLKDRKDASGWILSVGTHTARKNYIFQLDAMEPLWDSGQLKAPLILVGAFGPYTDLIKNRMRTSPTLRRYVFLLGAIPDEQLWALYKGARLYVLSSIYEGFGLTVPEAMQWGCPCFVSRAGATSEVGGAFVEYFDPRNPAQFRDMVFRFFTDPAFEAEMRDRAQRFKPQTWKNAVEDMLAYPDGGLSRKGAD